LGMLNFYLRFLPHASSSQAPLHDVLFGPKFKGSYPVTWSDALVAAFDECKASTSRAALLAHRDNRFTPLVSDASTTAIDAVLQSRCETPGRVSHFPGSGSRPSIKCIRQETHCDLWISEVLPAHVGGLAFHLSDGPQTARLHLPP